MAFELLLVLARRLLVLGLLVALFVRARYKYSAAGFWVKAAHVFSLTMLISVGDAPRAWLVTATIAVMRGDANQLDESFGFVSDSLTLFPMFAVCFLSWSLAVVYVLWIVGLAFGDQLARRNFVKALPLIYIVHSFIFWLQFIDGGRRLWEGRVLLQFCVAQVMHFCIIGWVFVAMYLFYGTTRADALFLQGAQVGPSPGRGEEENGE